MLDTLNIETAGKTFLDIGPGYGTALDVAKARGASGTYFLDYDPFMYTFNRLKGHKGWRLDIRAQLGALPLRTFDIVWSKATFTADRFLAREKSTWVSAFNKYPRLHDLLLQFDRLATPKGVIIVCPHWDHVNEKRKVTDAELSSITETFLQHGYEMLPWIEGHNREPFHPITYLKREIQE